MPANRNALIRYKTIDKCLQNRYRKWSLENLIEAVGDALYEYEGVAKGISKRTIQGDIQLMRSDKLGYNAPIIVTDKKYYSYDDPDYSITNIPLSESDLNKIGDTVEFLKQFKDFSYFRELDVMLHKLEDQVKSQQRKKVPVIDFEKNENLKGLEFLDVLYKAITEKSTLTILYQSFKARQSNSFEFYPYLLKEFRNRWFVVGTRYRHTDIINLALDRIISVDKAKIPYYENPEFNPETYFKHALGVSVSHNPKIEEVLLFFNHRHAPYVITKPIHHSQEVIERNYFGIIIRLHIQLNFELEKDILGFGEGVKVIKPQLLRKNIQNRIREAQENYDTDYSPEMLKILPNKVKYKGYAYFKYVFEKKDTKQILQLYRDSDTIDLHESRNFFQQNTILRSLLEPVMKDFVVQYVAYFNNLKDVPTNWKQNEMSNPEDILMIIPLQTHPHTRLSIELIPHSNKQILDKDQFDFAIENYTRTCRDLNRGDLHLIHPQMLYRYVYHQTKRELHWLEVLIRKKPD